MEESIINKNIDLFIDLEYSEEGELLVSVLISENNQLEQVGTYKKDTKTNLEKFTTLYGRLDNPLIVMDNLEENMSRLFSEFRKHGLSNTKIFYDYFHDEHFFIDSSKNLFIAHKKIEEDRELHIIKTFLNYIYFQYNIKNRAKLDFENEEVELSPEYEKKMELFRYIMVDKLKEKPYYEQLSELVEGL